MLVEKQPPRGWQAGTLNFASFRLGGMHRDLPDNLSNFLEERDFRTMNGTAKSRSLQRQNAWLSVSSLRGDV
jgi:hypothetical protein